MQINEIFNSIQGEGYFAGTPATFVRLQGCGVGCGWCDTKHSWDKRAGAEMQINEIIRSVSRQHVIITGGEPCEQELGELTQALSGKFIQLETSGTSPLSGEFNWVTLSPKINMPGGKAVLDNVISKCNELKFVIGKQSDIKNLDRIIKKLSSSAVIYLQPVSQSKKALEICLEQCATRGFSLSVQTHKFLGIR
jgi:7-carboxy-7-deazaguanine synthase